MIREGLLWRVRTDRLPWEKWMKVDCEVGELMRVVMVGFDELEERVRACL